MYEQEKKKNERPELTLVISLTELLSTHRPFRNQESSDSSSAMKIEARKQNYNLVEETVKTIQYNRKSTKKAPRNGLKLTLSISGY